MLEKKQRDKGRQHESNLCRHLSWRDGYYDDLIPLRSIRLFNAEPLVLQVLRDIAFAFRDSLEELTVEDFETFETELTDLETTSQVVYGKDWDLPCLRTLSKSASFSVMFRSGCTTTISRFGVTLSAGQRDDLQSSRHLVMVARPPLTPQETQTVGIASLHHSPCLEELTLGISVFNRTYNRYDCYIPSHEDLEREDSDDHELSGTPGSVSHEYRSTASRPRWTWDWYLPKLSKLHLDAVFAYKFDFQWLQHLPNLQHIRLNITSENNLHVQFIGLKDLLKRKQEQQDRMKSTPYRIGTSACQNWSRSILVAIGSFMTRWWRLFAWSSPPICAV